MKADRSLRVFSFSSRRYQPDQVTSWRQSSNCRVLPSMSSWPHSANNRCPIDAAPRVEAMPLSSVKGRTTNDATHSGRRTLDVSDKNVLPVSAAAKAAQWWNSIPRWSAPP
jgi:hypothetical protein